MATYSIKDLEKLSGIKAHTIRIWEQRYSIIAPKRTDTNIRYYTDEDLKYILNIAFLNKSGMRISKISKMSSSEIANVVQDLSKNNYENSAILQTLTMAMVELNSQKFEEVLDNNIDQEGVEKTILNVIVPFMEKLGLLWFTGSISAIHEQFVYCLIRQKIITTIDKLAPLVTQEDTVVLYLPEGDEQEINILLVYYILKYRGFSVIYLGAQIPIEELDIVYHIHNPKYIYTIPSETKNKVSPQKYVDKLCIDAPQRKFLIGTHQVSSKLENLPNNAQELEDFNAVIEFFDNLKSE